MLSMIDIKSSARKRRARVGIGALPDNGKDVLRSVEIAEENGYAEVIVFDAVQDLMVALRDNYIDAAVKGNFAPISAYDSITETFRIQERIERIALVQTSDGDYIFIGPVDPHSGRTYRDRLEVTRRGVRFISSLDERPSVGILSVGHPDIMGRDANIDKWMEEAEKLVKELKKDGIEAKNYYMDMEAAVEEDRNFIVMPDGVSGNAAFQSLAILGGGAAIGAPIINLPRVFIDTPSITKDYVDAIAFASVLGGARHVA